MSDDDLPYKLIAACDKHGVREAPPDGLRRARQAIEKMSPREQYALRAKLSCGLPLSHTAAQWGVSVARVQQIYARALSKARDAVWPPTPAEKQARLVGIKRRNDAAAVRAEAENERNRLAAEEEHRKWLVAERERRKIARTERELAELARLKARYEPKGDAMKTLAECLAIPPDQLRAECATRGITTLSADNAYYGGSDKFRLRALLDFCAEFVRRCGVKADDVAYRIDEDGDFELRCAVPIDWSDPGDRAEAAHVLHEAILRDASPEERLAERELAELRRLRAKYGDGAR